MSSEDLQKRNRTLAVLLALLLSSSPSAAQNDLAQDPDVHVYPGTRMVVTPPVDPESFPDLPVEEWPSGPDVLARHDGEALADDVLSQVWSAETVSALTGGVHTKRGFLVWDEVPVFVSTRTTDLVVGRPLETFYNWYSNVGIQSLPITSASELHPGANFIVVSSSGLYRKTKDERADFVMDSENIITPRTSAEIMVNNLNDSLGCTGKLVITKDDDNPGIGAILVEARRFPDDPGRSEAFARNCLFASSWQIFGFPFSDAFASRYGADLFAIAPAAVDAINRCAQTPDNERPVMNVEQLPGAACVRQTFLTILNTKR